MQSFNRVANDAMMPISPKVYIILLNFNNWQDTLECLESLLKIDYSNYHIIIVDNASTDNSVEYIRQWADRSHKTIRVNVLAENEKYKNEIDTSAGIISLILANENYGYAGGNNAGVKVALRGDPDYLLLLNNDTIVDPDFLFELVSAGEAHREIGFLGPKIYCYDHPNVLWYAGGEISLRRGLSRHHGFREKDLGQCEEPRYVNFVTGCSFLVKSDVIRQIGFLDEAMFCYGEDADLCVRAVKAGYRGYYVPTAKVWHKIGRSSSHLGNDFSIYMGTRNAMYLVFKHASRVDFLFFLFFFSFDWLLRNTVSSLLSGNFGIMIGMYRGFLHFWPMRKKRMKYMSG